MRSRIGRNLSALEILDRESLYLLLFHQGEARNTLYGMIEKSRTHSSQLWWKTDTCMMELYPRHQSCDQVESYPRKNLIGILFPLVWLQLRCIYADSRVPVLLGDCGDIQSFQPVLNLWFLWGFQYDVEPARWSCNSLYLFFNDSFRKNPWPSPLPQNRSRNIQIQKLLELFGDAFKGNGFFVQESGYWNYEGQAKLSHPIVHQCWVYRWKCCQL